MMSVRSLTAPSCARSVERLWRVCDEMPQLPTRDLAKSGHDMIEPMGDLLIVLALGLANLTAPSAATASPAGDEVHAAKINHPMRSARYMGTAGQVLVGL
jgi:hypothetical protein